MLKHEETVYCRTSLELRRQLALMESTYNCQGGAGVPLAGAVEARLWRDDDSGEIVLEINEASA
jgi:hypothetical protein